jgi:predicted NUDIX family NTP pyrophosphohydrolase
MRLQSAGVLVYRSKSGMVEVLLAHPGGPFWTNRDEGAWTIPKGEFDDSELALDAARREFAEEIGMVVPPGDMMSLGSARQPNGKIIHAWAVKGDLDAGAARSNIFEMEWPPKSGETRQFPEIERAAWFGLDEAAVRLRKGQVPLLQNLARALGAPIGELDR